MAADSDCRLPAFIYSKNKRYKGNHQSCCLKDSKLCRFRPGNLADRQIPGYQRDSQERDKDHENKAPRHVSPDKPSNSRAKRRGNGNDQPANPHDLPYMGARRLLKDNIEHKRHCKPRPQAL